MPGSFLTDDLPVFLATEEFAVEVTRYDRTTFDAIFDREYDPQLGVESYRPILVCRSADVADLKGGDRLQVLGTWYRISGPIRADGTGMSELDLKEYVE